MNPRVREVCAGDGYTLNLTFDNGEERVFDVEPYLSTGVFRALRDPEAFARVKAFMGSVAWAGGQDLCPDTLYEEGIPVRGFVRTKKVARQPRVSRAQD
jgi:hypothetical protein